MDLHEDPWADATASAPAATRCAVCLETVDADGDVCPECGEAFADGPNSSVWPPSTAESAGESSWLRMHWRPLVTLFGLVALLATGLGLRRMAPHRYQPPQMLPTPGAAIEPACDNPCWNGEACRLGRCVWQLPNGVGHLPGTPTVAGAFALAADMSDVLALDSERYAVASLQGVRVDDARTGAVLTLVNEAPQAQRLVSVGDALYATAPTRIYVIDRKEPRVLKTIEVGSSVADVSVGGSGRRVIASLPAAHSAVVIATDYHAEVARFFFAEDQVRPVTIDEAGERALATNGDLPLPGLRPSLQATRYGAIYAFDPRRLPSAQDRVRTGMSGNPVDVLMVPDSRTSFVVLREKNAIVPLEHLESGTVRQGKPIATCQGPEQIELIRPGRRAIVRCDAGHAVDVLSLSARKRLRRIGLNARVSDMAVTPDGKQAVMTLPRDGGGAVALLDLGSYELRIHELRGEPHRVRLAPDGRMAVVISDSAKLAWVLR
jgi:DNA-binding beta-propeller fold protein YncE